MKAYIFDLDGVIVDTAKYHYEAWKALANSLSFEFPVIHNERQKGVSRMESLEVVLEVGQISGLTMDEKIALADKKNNIYLEMIAGINKEQLLPGIESFLIKLKEKGYLIALGSASKSGKMILEKLGITSYFDVIVDGNLVTKAKPDPEVFLKAAELMAVDPKECTVIEDAAAGVKAAKKANMKCIGIGDKEILKEADLVIESTSELNTVTE